MLNKLRMNKWANKRMKHKCGWFWSPHWCQPWFAGHTHLLYGGEESGPRVGIVLPNIQTSRTWCPGIKELSGGRGVGSGNNWSFPRSSGILFAPPWAFCAALSPQSHHGSWKELWWRVMQNETAILKSQLFTPTFPRNLWCKTSSWEAPRESQLSLLSSAQSARDGGSWEETNAVVLVLERGKLRQRLSEGVGGDRADKGTTVAISKGLPATPHALAHMEYSKTSASLPGDRGFRNQLLPRHKCRKQDPSFSWLFFILFW